MRISDWSSDVCSSDLAQAAPYRQHQHGVARQREIKAEAAQNRGWRDHPDQWGAERAMAVGVPPAQDQHRKRYHEKRKERARIRNVRKLADREERGGDGDEKAGDRGHDVRRLPFGVNVRQFFGQQAVARHDEEDAGLAEHHHQNRSEEHTSELQSLMRISYAVFCLKKTK